MGQPLTPSSWLVSFPTTFRKGFTRNSIWGGTKPAMPEPSDVQGHETTVLHLLSWPCWPRNTQDESAVRANEHSPEGYLSRDTVICFLEVGSLFSLAVASSQTAPGIRDTSFADKFQPLRANTWHLVNEMCEAVNNKDMCFRPLRATMLGQYGRTLAQAIGKARGQICANKRESMTRERKSTTHEHAVSGAFF